MAKEGADANVVPELLRRTGGLRAFVAACVATRETDD